MTETQKRIKALKASLPGLKERVLAVALLLVMSAAMMTSATYAWLTISLRPELTGVNTSVAANGNLEIALATGNGKTAPGESKVGDSSAAQDQTITGANITWGNLVNLGDPQYGLENLTLRPAQLNTAALLSSPLYGAVYNTDGRISQLTSNFAYASWVLPTDEEPNGYFLVSKDTGVRAITSTKIEAPGAAQAYIKMVSDTKDTNLAAANTYTGLGNNSKYMQSLATMMGLFMTARMNPGDASLSNPTVNIEDIQNLRDMYGAFLECFDWEADAIAKMINLQLFLKNGAGNYTEYDYEMVYASSAAKLTALGVKISDLDQFIKDRNTIASDYEKLKVICSSGSSLTWKDTGLVDIVNNLVDVGKCTIGADNTPISSIGASNAMGYLSGTQEAKITNGILYRFEERTGGYIEVKSLSISATVKRSGITVPATVKANIQTTAPRDYNLFNNDMIYTESLNDGTFEGGVAVAKDTYGLAIDLWVRTNAEGSYLTLEGNVITETERDVAVKGEDANGNMVQLYVLTRSEERYVENEDGTTGPGKETISYSVDVYLVETKDADGNVTETKYYNAETHREIAFQEETDTVRAKVKDVVTVVGYEGVNRVWGDNELLSSDSTTQGSGSCYVYYADTPEDQARSLELLQSFIVAFIDDEGKLMAKAIMDTEHYYAVNGRVIVPLILDTGSAINLGEDYEGQITYAITALEKNIPKRITAIVYLDGTKLNNDQVLSAADIQGQLNIQFGSSADLNSIENEDLSNKERRVSASVDVTTFDFETFTGKMITNVKVNVDGDAPNKVTGFFVRQISSTQGTRELPGMTFEKNTDGEWVADYTFSAPGVYVLRSVELDGVEYILENPQTVTVTGFSVKSLRCNEAGDNRTVKVLTAADSSTVNLELQFGSSDKNKMPKTVQGRYLREDGSAVNVNFTYNSTSGKWTGSATFLSSGDYTLQYLLLDGKYTELDPAMWQYADITLGMRVAVFTTSPLSFKYEPMVMEDNMKLLGMQVKILDNNGDEMAALSGVKLTYTMKGSGIKKMDTELVWDGEYYVGELTTTGPGIWQFSSVVVGSNTLTTATTSPTFTIRSPEPPAYYGTNTASNQIKLDPATDPAVMNVQISNSMALEKVYARIVKKGETEGVWVLGKQGNEFVDADKTSVNHWSFEVPKNANGYQDGEWQLVEIKITDALKEDGSSYSDDDPLLIDLAEKNNKTKVVNQIYVTIPVGQSKDFGKNANGEVTAEFMATHTISKLNVNIFDYENQPIAGVMNVQYTFTYSGKSSDYGFYTSDGLNNLIGVESIVVNLDTNNGINFAQSNNAELQFAGEYATALRFEIDTDGDGVANRTFSYTGSQDNAVEGTKALPDNAPVFTVSSAKPSVTITAVTPGTSETFSTTKSVGGTIVEVSNVFNFVSAEGDYAVVYLKGTKSWAGNWGYSLPRVTLKLDGVAAFDSATLTIINQADPSTTHEFSFTSTNKEVSQSVGKSVGVSGNHDEKYLAGTTTFREIPITYKDMVFNVQLTKPVTIDQQEAPFVLSFAGVPNAIPEADRPTETTANGSEVTVYLPKLTWVETMASNPTYSGWSAWTKNQEIRTDYTTRTRRIGSSWTGYYTEVKYQYYTWTEYKRTRTVTGETMGQNMIIDSWTINGLTYTAGYEYTITLSGDTVATANISEDGKPYSLGNTTTTESDYQYGYVKVSGTKDSAPTGGIFIMDGGWNFPSDPKLYSAGNVYPNILDYEDAWP